MYNNFQRINFFRGLFMQAEDWQKAQLYHLEKHRFHNRFLHDPGVASGCLEDLRVTASPDGYALTIAPGYAIDGDGNDLFLPEPRELKVPPLNNFNPPTTLYVSIRYDESPTDQRTDEANPAYSGPAYIEESVIIELTTTPPDNKSQLELARVTLPADADRIKNPPAANTSSTAAPCELDFRSVPLAGTKSHPSTRQLSLADLGVKVLDTTIQIRTGSRKQDDTSVLIEKFPKNVASPMYMVHAQSMDGARIQWWIECNGDAKTGGGMFDDGCAEYSLHIKNYSDKATTVRCVVYSMRI